MMRSFSRIFRVLLSVVLLLVGAHRLPAPIQEVPESPTPAPQQSTKPKPKRTAQPKVTSESSESSTKRQTPSPQQNQPVPNRNLFDGTWVGTLNNLPFLGNVEFTLTISGSGTFVVEKSAQTGTKNFRATHDGSSMRWIAGGNSAWTFTPNPDQKTALAIDNVPGLFGVGAYNGTAVFRRILP